MAASRKHKESTSRAVQDDHRLRGIAGYVNDVDSGEFDRLIYERFRLGILSALAVSDVLSFAKLRSLLNTTDGNLSAHARKLEEAGYISCKKTFADRRPRTEYRLTARGRKIFMRYLSHMEALIEATRG